MRTHLLRSLSVLSIVMLVLLSGIPGIAQNPAAAAGLLNNRIFLPIVIRGGSSTTPPNALAPSDSFVELPALRQENTRVMMGAVAGEPVLRYQRYAEPIYFQDSTSGSWLPIDTQLIHDAAGGYHNTAASFNATFADGSSSSSTTALVDLQRTGQLALKFRLSQNTSLVPVVDGDTITYPNVASQTDLIYQVRSWGIKEDVVLRSADAPSSFTLLLDIPGGQVQSQGDGSWSITDNQGKSLWHIPAPNGADANGAIAPVTLTISPESGHYRVTLAVASSWLTNPDRAFPVRLDPTLADPHFFGGESYVQSTSPNIIAWNQRNRFIGRSTYVGNKGITRIFTPVDLSFLPASASAAQITSAQLVFTQYVSENAAGFQTSVYPPLAPWSDATLTWNNQPIISSPVASGVTVTPSLGPKSWDITSWVKQVRGGSMPNYGLMIAADNESLGGGIFWSSICRIGVQCASSNDRPYLQIEVSASDLAGAFFGDGRDGDLVVGTGQTVTIDTVHANVSASGAAAAPATSTGFSVGDTVLFHQTQGATAPGHWEFGQIQTIISPTSWALVSPLNYSYDNTSGRAQVIKIPQYQNVTVDSGGVLTAPAWDESTGGILVFAATGAVAINGQATMAGKGFKGGYGNDSLGTPCAATRQGQQGQSALGAGGCGQGTNEGGGGGGDIGSGDPHWGSGAGGGYGSGGGAGSGPYPGSGGATYGGVSLALLDLGAGGGGGSWGTNPSGGGRNTIEGDDTAGQGAGAILAFGRNINAFNATSNGNAGGNSANPGFGGYAGGGGAGGSIKVVGENVTVNAVIAVGGAGGSGRLGNGGAGGVGRIRIEYCNTFQGSTTPVPSALKINCTDQTLDSGLNVSQDVWSFANRSGIPSFAQFSKDYGIPATTHLITETKVIAVISATNTLSLPIGFAPDVFQATLPLTPTAGLTTTEVISTGGKLIPRPIPYLYQEIIVKAIYDDQFSQYYASSLKGGLCAGMAATVADFHSNGGPQPSTYGGGSTVISIPDNPQAQEFIQKYHGRQVSSQVLNWLAEAGHFDATGLYNHLSTRIATPDWWQNPEVIGIVKGANCQDIEIGHALLPYKIVPQPGNRARIYVYDSNYPPSTGAIATSRYIEVDQTANRWSYELVPATSTTSAITWVGHDLYSTPLSLFREQPVLPTQSGTDILMVDGGQRMGFGGQRMGFGGQRMGFGEGDDGTYTGCVVGDTGAPTFINTISHTFRVTPLAGGQDGTAFPDTLFFPFGRNWRFTEMGVQQGGTGDMMVFGPHGISGYLTRATSTTKDNLSVDSSFHSMAVRTADPSKPVSAYQMRETADWTRIYAVSNTTLAAGEALTLTIGTALDQFEVVNDAPISKTFDLGVGHIGSDAINTMTYPHQTIGPHERRIYTPILWSDLKNAPIKVEIDVNADGTIDRTELLGGRVLPIAVHVSAIPNTPGQVFPILNGNEIEHGHYGWVNLDHRLAPNEHATPDRIGDEGTLQRWLADGKNPTVAIGDRLVGIRDAHDDILEAIHAHIRGKEKLYHVGDIVIIPLYDRIDVENDRYGGKHEDDHDRAHIYRIVGFAVVRLVESPHTGDDDEHNGQSDDTHGATYQQADGADQSSGDGDHDDDEKHLLGQLIAKIVP